MSKKVYPVIKKIYRKGKKNGPFLTNSGILKISKKRNSNREFRVFAIDTSDNQFEKSNTGKKSPISEMRHTLKKINDQKLKYKNDTMTQITSIQNEVETLKNNKSEIEGKIKDLNCKIDTIVSEYNQNCAENEKMDDGKSFFECCLVM